MSTCCMHMLLLAISFDLLVFKSNWKEFTLVETSYFYSYQKFTELPMGTSGICAVDCTAYIQHRGGATVLSLL